MIALCVEVFRVFEIGYLGSYYLTYLVGPLRIDDTEPPLRLDNTEPPLRIDNTEPPLRIDNTEPPL